MGDYILYGTQEQPEGNAGSSAGSRTEREGRKEEDNHSSHRVDRFDLIHILANQAIHTQKVSSESVATDDTIRPAL